jgi:hypothetical protein
VPYRSLFAFRKVAEKVVAHLTAKFNWPVVVIANRTIISKHGKYPFLTSFRSFFFHPEACWTFYSESSMQYCLLLLAAASFSSAKRCS